MAEYKHFELQELDGVTIVLLLDSKLLRQHILDELRDELLGYIDVNQPDKLLVFFGQVEYCTSAAISGLLSVKRRMAVYGGEVKLCALTAAVEESFGRLGLTGAVFQVFDSVGEAVESFGQ